MKPLIASILLLITLGRSFAQGQTGTALDSPAGVWISADLQHIFRLEIMDGGSYQISFNGQIRKGTWRLEDGQITLEYRPSPEDSVDSSGSSAPGSLTNPLDALKRGTSTIGKLLRSKKSDEVVPARISISLRTDGLCLTFPPVNLKYKDQSREGIAETDKQQKTLLRERAAWRKSNGYTNTSPSFSDVFSRDPQSLNEILSGQVVGNWSRDSSFRKDRTATLHLGAFTIEGQWELRGRQIVFVTEDKGATIKNILRYSEDGKQITFYGQENPKSTWNPDQAEMYLWQQSASAHSASPFQPGHPEDFKASPSATSVVGVWKGQLNSTEFYLSLDSYKKSNSSGTYVMTVSYHDRAHRETFGEHYYQRLQKGTWVQSGDQISLLAPSAQANDPQYPSKFPGSKGFAFVQLAKGELILSGAGQIEPKSPIISSDQTNWRKAIGIEKGDVGGLLGNIRFAYVHALRGGQALTVQEVKKHKQELARQAKEFEARRLVESKMISEAPIIGNWSGHWIYADWSKNPIHVQIRADGTYSVHIDGGQHFDAGWSIMPMGYFFGGGTGGQACTGGYGPDGLIIADYVFKRDN